MFVSKLRSLWTAAFLPTRRPLRRTRLSFERLETRDVPAIIFDPIGNFNFPGGKDLFVPFSATDTNGDPISYQVVSDNSSISATIVNGGTTIKLNVSGKDGDGNDFTGDLYFRLFDSVAPNTAAQIIELVTNSFYNGKVFHRVIDGFMAQGGSANGSGSGSSGSGTVDDEFNPAYAFVSPGVIAMANSGDDTNDSQFFIVDTDLDLAGLPQHLNYNHTVIGMLVGGFDTFTKIMSTDVEEQSIFNPEISKPVSPMTINTAEVFADSTHHLLQVHAAAGFVGSAGIKITATSTSGAAESTFTAASVADTVNDRAILGAVNNLTTAAASPVSFTIPAIDLENDKLTYVIRSATNFVSPPSNVNIHIDQKTGKATLTPLAGFTGKIDFLVGVRDQTNRGGANAALDDQTNFDTQLISLTVNAAEIDLDNNSDNGLFNDDNYTSVANPSFTIQAPTGMTVAVSVNGAGSFAAAESSPGVYKVTLPVGTLALGPNTIGATVTGGAGGPQSLTPLTVTYGPNTQTGVYVVPGAVGTPQNMTFTLGSAEALFQSEIGFFAVDDVTGKIGTLSPGDAGYAAAAMSRKQLVVAPDQPAGSDVDATLNGGSLIGFYMIPNGNSADFVANNPTNALNGQTLAYFSFIAANPDGVNHVVASSDPFTGNAVLGWEDMQGGGDRDYNDRVITINRAGTAAPAPIVRVPAGMSRNATALFRLENAIKSLAGGGSTRTTAVGEVGFFRVDDIDGRIGTLMPGDVGYVQAALSSRQIIFANNATSGTQFSSSLPGDTLLGFYVVPGGTASTVLSSNPNNLPTGTFAIFSFADANPDSQEHFRFFTPEGAARPEPTLLTPLRIHASTVLNGTIDDFDDLTFTVGF